MTADDDGFDWEALHAELSAMPADYGPDPQLHLDSQLSAISMAKAVVNRDLDAYVETLFHALKGKGPRAVVELHYGHSRLVAHLLFLMERSMSLPPAELLEVVRVTALQRAEQGGL